MKISPFCIMCCDRLSNFIETAVYLHQMIRHQANIAIQMIVKYKKEALPAPQRLQVKD